jgi:hypothetical protein
VGRTDPGQYGFDASDGPTSNGGPDNVDNPHPKELYGMTERGLDFITRQVKAGRPFYVQLSHYASRQGGDASPQALAAVKSWGRRLSERELSEAAATLDLDIALGMVLHQLDALGIADGTYVIFTTDHGSPGRNPPFSGGKGTVSEGGLRVPLVIRGPGIKPGVCSHVRTIGADLFPAIAELARVSEPVPKGVEGGSLASLLANAGEGTVRRLREEFVVHFPHYDKDPVGPASAILLGDFKLIRVYETNARRLFNIATDPGERHDLAREMPEKAKELDQRLSDYLAAVNAQMPTIKQPDDPSPVSEPRRGGDGRSKNKDKLSPPEGKRGRDQGAEKEPTQNSACNDVPAHPFDLILGRPTRDAITVSVLAYQDAEGLIAYGPERDHYTRQTPTLRFVKGEPVEIVIGSLQPDTRYFYQFRADDPKSIEGTFHTQRPPGGEFTFTVTADSHLDDRTSAEVYQRTLANALADGPDFHIDLGDTFMTEKHDSRASAARQYLAQRFYFGQLCHTAPLFVALGNHDGESPRGSDADSLAVWSNMMRKRYFPNPVPDGFYSGNMAKHPEAGLLQDYYAWQWGDALFVVLDLFWYAEKQRGRSDNWSRTLGANQYQWLTRTLEESKAQFKFVFIHHLVGGATPEGRGGVEAAGLFEWGGRNPDGADAFKEQRRGWPTPIHPLLVRNHVNIVFHGHDHLYAKQDLDGVVYQAVPQPGDPKGSARSAAEYSYASGVLHGSSGHVRVAVSAGGVTVDYVRSDRSVAHSYSILSGRRP